MNKSSSSVCHTSSKEIEETLDECGGDLGDLNSHTFKLLYDVTEIENLKQSEFSDNAFPVEGIIFGPNCRLMVPLDVQIVRPFKDIADLPTMKVWFCVNTCSYKSFLNKNTMVLLTANKIGVPLAVFATVQDKRISAEFHLSEGNVKEANVLGMAALRKLKAFVGDLDWNTGKFKLVKN